MSPLGVLLVEDERILHVTSLRPWHLTQHTISLVVRLAIPPPLHCSPRRAVYDICCEYNLVILEDDPYFYLQYTKPRLPRCSGSCRSDIGALGADIPTLRLLLQPRREKEGEGRRRKAKEGERVLRLRRGATSAGLVFITFARQLTSVFVDTSWWV